MARFKSQYKSSTDFARSQRRLQLLRWGLMLLAIGLLFCIVALATGGFDKVKQWVAERASRSGDTFLADDIGFKRIGREGIPMAGFYGNGYNRLFPDINDIQLQSAKKWGVSNLASYGDSISSCKRLRRITSNRLYYIDVLTHSQPYLVPEAVAMLYFVGDRFAAIVKERSRDNHTYRPIITSVTRSERDMYRLLRHNSNASQQSCHCYGTTVDITYTRFLRDDGFEVQEEWLTRALAQAMYELRYEGICFVRFEVKQTCFHITVRNVEYNGKEKSSMQRYPDLLRADVMPQIDTVVASTASPYLYDEKKEEITPRRHVDDTAGGNYVQY